MPGHVDGPVPPVARRQLRWVVADPGLEAESPCGFAAQAPARRQRLIRHAPGQCPYVAVRVGRMLIHAQEIAWYAERVMIRYPLLITDRHHFSSPVICWVHRFQTRRIAREDAVWNDPRDDIDWHEIEDESM